MTNTTMNTVEFGKHLRKLRAHRPIDEIARAAGLPESVITAYEYGEVAAPEFTEVVRIGNAYDLRPDEIASLAGVYDSTETGQEAVGPASSELLRRLRTHLVVHDVGERREVIAFINAYLKLREANQGNVDRD